MQFNFNMTREEAIQWEHYFKTETLVFQTQFKNGRYISTMENGFSARKFVGTWEDYTKATKIYNDSHDYGKIIGTKTFTLEEWAAIHKTPEPTKKARTWLQFIKDEKSEGFYQIELARARCIAQRRAKNKIY